MKKLIIITALIAPTLLHAQDTLMSVPPPLIYMASLEMEQDAYQSNTGAWFALMGAAIGSACLLADNKEVGYSILGLGVAVGISCNINATKHRKRAALYLQGK